MSGLSAPISRALTPAQILARLRMVDGPGSGLDADLVLAPLPRAGGSFGGFPSSTSGLPIPLPNGPALIQSFLMGN